jgi:hypothetical protein
VVELPLEHVKIVRRKVKGRRKATAGVAERVCYYGVTPGLPRVPIPYPFGSHEFVALSSNVITA